MQALCIRACLWPALKLPSQSAACKQDTFLLNDSIKTHVQRRAVHQDQSGDRSAGSQRDQ